VRRAVLGLALLLLGSTGCAREGNGVRYPVTNNPAGQPAASQIPVGARGSWSSAYLFLPGQASRSWVRYSVVGGQAFREGDIALGPANTLFARYGFPRYATGQQKSAVAHKQSVLWTNNEIPFEIDGSATDTDRHYIAWAVEQMSTTPLRLRPRTANDVDYVVFKNAGDGCYSYYGRTGGAQEVHIGGCGKGGPLHEVLHAAGFEHEHTRSDRDAHITVYMENVSAECQHLFDRTESVPSTSYDTDSVMHYASYACSRGGEPTMLRKSDGRPIKDAEALSALDRAGIQALYGGTPTPPSVIPTPNPTVLPFPWQAPTWTPAEIPGMPALPAGWTLPGFPSAS
jgi:hypothetical protein